MDSKCDVCVHRGLKGTGQYPCVECIHDVCRTDKFEEEWMNTFTCGEELRTWSSMSAA